MSPEEVYALLKKAIALLNVESIGAAVEAFLAEHPDYFLESLGLYKDEEGYICQLSNPF